MKIHILFLSMLAAAQALAQADPATERRDIMRALQDEGYNPIHAMVHGEAPYDRARVERAFALMERGLDRATGLWPPNTPSDPANRYGSSPQVWERMADFYARLNNAKKLVDAAALDAAKGLEGLKAALPRLDEACVGCHETYRIRQR